MVPRHDSDTRRSDLPRYRALQMLVLVADDVAAVERANDPFMFVAAAVSMLSPKREVDFLFRPRREEDEINIMVRGL